ncbi:MAG: hypothetical protein J6Q79_05275 [Clostridia bacterium]|nr:hypothetical protein [Clostridia bacterium]
MSRKVYVRVLAETDEEGNINPISVTWEDGRTFIIDKVTDIRRAYAVKVGGTAIRYSVKICGKDTFLFAQEGKWFVESKV